MRKEWVLFGIALLFIGLIVTSATASSQQENVVTRDEVAKKINLLPNASSWWIDGNFNRGRRLYLSVQPGRDWTVEPIQPALHNLIWPLFVPVTITDPHRGETKLDIIFATIPTDPEQRVAFWAVNVTSNDGGLTFEKSNEWQIDEITYYQEVRAVVNYDGIYNVTIGRIWGMHSPPPVVSLESLLIEIEYPYWFVIPIGVALMIVGVSISMWAAKSSTQ